MGGREKEWFSGGGLCFFNLLFPLHAHTHTTKLNPYFIVSKTVPWILLWTRGSVDARLVLGIFALVWSCMCVFCDSCSGLFGSDAIDSLLSLDFGGSGGGVTSGGLFVANEKTV